MIGVASMDDHDVSVSGERSVMPSCPSVTSRETACRSAAMTNIALTMLLRTEWSHPVAGGDAIATDVVMGADAQAVSAPRFDMMTALARRASNVIGGRIGWRRVE